MHRTLVTTHTAQTYEHMKRFGTDIDVRLIFTSFKIKNFFSFKDPIPDSIQLIVVYEFNCAGCNSRYIGETLLHLSNRIREHTTTKTLISTDTFLNLIYVKPTIHPLASKS